MCGITGIVYNDRFGDFRHIKKMSDTIAHRGPDGEGFLAINSFSKKVYPLAGARTPVQLPFLTDFSEDANVFLAHRRLSIIDLSKQGHQPMSNNDETLWITFNGEIYNYKSLKNELSEFEFRSNCDTEVLLYAYEKWGEACLQKLNGMFSFVIYDKRKNILFGARDRFGVKPFYYVRDKNFFAFNSEIKGLVCLDFVQKKVDRDVAFSFLTFNQQYYGERTFFDNIKELLPSHCFFYDLENYSLHIKKYYELNFNDVWEKYDESRGLEHIEKIRELVYDSVECRLNSDVLVGSCLSGGIDSSAIVSVIGDTMKKNNVSSLGKKQKCVTACYTGKKIDESNWAKIVAEHVGAEWCPVYPNENDLVDDLNKLVYTQDMPFGSTSIYAQYRVMKAAKEAGITVMLDGQGGDELFCGYPHFYSMFYWNAFKRFDFSALYNERKNIANSPLIHGNINKLLAKEFALSVLNFFPNELYFFIKNYYVGSGDKYLNFSGKFFPQKYCHTINEYLAYSMTDISLPVLLRYEDKNSMCFSIESRTPFADDMPLIEYLNSISASYKVHNGWSKYLLREAMTDVLPQEIKTRVDKIGFATPENEWMYKLKPMIFDGDNMMVNEYIDMKMLEKEFDKLTFGASKTGLSNIWKYVNFILWFKLFGVR